MQQWVGDRSTTDDAQRPARAAACAILEAARTLATEHGADGFTVERVATVAGVSRRTVFNHFAGLDQLLVAVCEQILAEATLDLLGEVDRRTADLPAGGAGGRAALDAVGEATRASTCPTAIATIHGSSAAPTRPTSERRGISRTAFEHVGGRLRERLVHRAPGLDPVDLEIDLDPAHQRARDHRPALDRGSTPT